MLIDDGASIRELVQACLSDLAGWKVWTAAFAQEGLYWLEQERPDAILLDVLMPGMNITTFLHKLHEHPLNELTPVILLSVRAPWFTLQRLQQMRVVEAIAKPFNPVALPMLIAQALQWEV